MLSAATIARHLRRLHRLRAADPVEERLRGWNWKDPPLRPRYDFQLGVSEVAYRYCPTRRDLFVRRVLGIQARPSRPMLKGRVVHAAFHLSANDLMRLVLGDGVNVVDAVAALMSDALERGKRVLELAGVAEPDAELERFAARVYRRMVLEWGGWILETRSPPWLTEWEVDGSLLGLSKRLRVDALAFGVVVEVKYGRWSDSYPVALAGYALALEANLETPFDYGLVIMVNGDGSRLEIEPVYIGNEEREAFIRARDEAAEMIASKSDPGRPHSCPDSCPFRPVCPRR